MAELIIDSNYYNKLDIEGFSKMMSSPSYCYKFYWLEAPFVYRVHEEPDIDKVKELNKFLYNFVLYIYKD